MPATSDRFARNEALFRQVNERVLEVNKDFDTTDGLLNFICECGRVDCTEPVSLILNEYEAVRAHPTHFVVVPGHEAQFVEGIVARDERFIVVEKHIGEHYVAEETDPRR
jgi:hypothetical protein